MPQVPDLERRILIPERMNERLKILSKQPAEIAGALLYSTHQRVSYLAFRVETLYLQGCGSRTAVTIDQRREAILEQFLQDNLNYGSVRFHTHPLSGRTTHSPADIDYYSQRIAQNNRFISMIIGRNKRRIFAYGKGEGKTSSHIVKTPRDFKEKEKAVLLRIKDVADRLGYSSSAPRIRH